MTSKSWANEIYLDCSVIQGSTGTNILEIIISEDKICMGDTSTNPMCAKVNDEVQYKKSIFAKVSITDKKYTFSMYGSFNKLYKHIVLNRYTGKATVQYYDEKMNDDGFAVFQCKKITKKKKF